MEGWLDMERTRYTTRTRISIFGIMLLALMMISGAALAGGTMLDGPDPAFWLSDPDGVDGDKGIEQGDPIAGSSGTARVMHDGAKIKIKATGLEPGHVYTMWVVYFNDSLQCFEGCNGPDFAAAGGGVIWGAGKIGSGTGRATFVANLRNGDGAEHVGSTPPPPFAFAAYQAGSNNEFHVVIRSHGPKNPGLVSSQLGTYGGGCETNVGPFPEQTGDFPVPAAPGECGDIQLYVFK
jgi:hypothetical protein